MGFKNIVLANVGLLIGFAGISYGGFNFLESFPQLLTSSVVAVGYMFIMILMWLNEDVL